MPKLTVWMRPGLMPMRMSCSRTAPARFSPRARLYSGVPRASVKPAMIRLLGARLRKSATALILGISPAPTAKLSNSK